MAVGEWWPLFGEYRHGGEAVTTRDVLTALARTKTGRLSRQSETLRGVRPSTYACLVRRGAIIVDGWSAYVVITDVGRARIAPKVVA